jgi:dCMP deaminase
MNNKWKKRYIELAREIAQWSKDPSRKIGAIAVGSKGQILSQGYNGFPRGIDDCHDRLADRQLKYRYVVHAEMNVIYNASYSGASLDGATLYVWGLPACSECAKGIIQVGIKNVVMAMETATIPDQWIDSWQLTQKMFDEAGVAYEFIGLDSLASE